jgi:hypothetical protein
MLGPTGLCAAQKSALQQFGPQINKFFQLCGAKNQAISFSNTGT